MTSAITNALDGIGGIAFDENNAQSVIRYSTAILGLDTATQKAILSAAGLSEAEMAVAINVAAAMTATNGMTVAQLAEAAGIDVDTLAKAANAKTTDVLTVSIYQAMAASKQLTAEQLQGIQASLAQAGANANLSISYTGLAESARSAALASMVASPTFWVSALLTVIPLAISAFRKL